MRQSIRRRRQQLFIVRQTVLSFTIWFLGLTSGTGAGANNIADGLGCVGSVANGGTAIADGITKVGISAKAESVSSRAAVKGIGNGIYIGNASVLGIN